MIDLEPSYVLHTQPFQNTSLLVDLFCIGYGRVKAVARGARRPKSKFRSILLPFQPLLVSLVGRGEVKTLRGAEASVQALGLKEQRLFSGFYINELIVRLILPHEGHAGLYKCYQQALMSLAGTDELQPVLRKFELDLLNELGYGINLHTDCNSNEAITSTASYLFHPDVGFEKLASAPRQARIDNVFKGHHIESLRSMTFKDRECSVAAKRLLRQALQVQLGNKPLHSRKLFTVS